MGASSLTDMTLTDLQIQLQTSLGDKAIAHCTNQQLPARLQNALGEKDPKRWLSRLSLCSGLLQDQNVRYFVLDTLQFLDRSDLDGMTLLLQKISRSGLSIIAIDHHKTPIFFSTMREIVCTDDFIDIYVQSMWQASRRLNVKAPRAPKRVAPEPTRFQYMSRIFVA